MQSLHGLGAVQTSQCCFNCDSFKNDLSQNMHLGKTFGSSLWHLVMWLLSVICFWNFCLHVPQTYIVFPEHDFSWVSLWYTCCKVLLHCSFLYTMSSFDSFGFWAFAHWYLLKFFWLSSSHLQLSHHMIWVSYL